MAANINAFEVFAKIGVDSSGLKTGLTNAKGLLSGFGGVASGVFSSIAGLATKAFSAAANAAKNFMNDAFQTAANFEQAMAQVAATLGKSVDELNSDIQTVTINGKEFTGNLRDFAMEMGATTKFTSSEVAEAMNYMAMAGYSAVDTMNAIPSVLNLAAAGMMDLGRASDVVTDVQTAFGLTMDRTSQLIDEMAKASTAGNTKVSELGEAFLTVGGLAKELGDGYVTLADGTTKPIDKIQELETAFVAMASAGIKGSEAGMHMRNMILKLSAPTDTARKALEELGGDMQSLVFDDSGNMRSIHEILSDLQDVFKTAGEGRADKKLQLISDLFNARDSTTVTALIDAIENTNWNKIAESVLNYEGAAEKMAQTQLSTFQGQKTLLDSAMDNLKITLATSTNIPFVQMVQAATQTVQNMTEAFKVGGLGGLFEVLFTDISDFAYQMLEKEIPKLVAKIPSMIVNVLPSLIEGLLTITQSVLETLTSGKFLRNLRAAVRNSIFLVKTYFSEHGEELRKTGSDFFDLISSGLKTAATKIGTNLVPVITSIAKALTNPENLTDIFDTGFTIINNLVTGLLSPESIQELILSVPDIIKNLASGISDFLFGKDKDEEGGLFGAALKIAERIRDYMSDPESLKALEKAAEDTLNNLGDFLVKNIPLLIKYTVKIGQALAEGVIAAFMNFLAPVFNSEHGWMDEYLASDTDLSYNDWVEQRRGEERAAENDRNNYVGNIAEYGTSEGMLTANQMGYFDNAAAVEAYQKAKSRGYASGGVFTRPTYALIGEDGGEVVMPLEKNTGWIDSLASRLNQSSGGGMTIQFGNIYVNGSENAGEEVVRQIDSALRKYQISQMRGTGGATWRT
jgi:TP901 family phage tail tape measure protein